MLKDRSDAKIRVREPRIAGVMLVAVAVGALASLTLAAVPAVAADKAQPAKLMPIAAAIPDASRESGNGFPDGAPANGRSRPGRSQPERRCGTMELGKTPKQ